MNVGVIGYGNLGSSIVDGLIVSNFKGSIYASKRNWENTNQPYPESVTYTSSNKELIENCSILIIALKPYNVISFLTEYAHLIDKSKHTIISVATGITCDEMNSVIEGVDIFRAMPNTAIAVSESITAICDYSDNLNRKDVVDTVFQSVGTVIWINEELMESATVLGACGIAYVLRFMRAMIQGGIEVGFDAKTATKIVAQTVKGAAELIIKNNSHPEEEIDKVTTPKGCTIVGLNEMEHSGFSSALIKGIVTSYAKISK